VKVNIVGPNEPIRKREVIRGRGNQANLTLWRVNFGGPNWQPGIAIDNEEERELLIRALQNRRAKLLHQATIVMVGRTAHAARGSAYLVEQALGLLGAPLDCEHPDHLKDEEPVQLTTEARRLLGMSESEGNMGT
jgi:hypothetical protein